MNLLGEMLHDVRYGLERAKQERVAARRRRGRAIVPLKIAWACVAMIAASYDMYVTGYVCFVMYFLLELVGYRRLTQDMRRSNER